MKVTKHLLFRYTIFNAVTVSKDLFRKGVQGNPCRGLADAVRGTVGPENLPFLYAKYNHITFAALYALSEQI
jgi:hypothetical protein